MRSPLLETPEAVPADPPDDGVAAHYGDPPHEQRACVERGGVVDRSNRGVVRVSGPDRLSWMHNISTQHLEGLEPGTPTETLILTPQGRVQHHLSLVDDGESLWAHVEPGTAPELVEFLESMRFMLRVEPADVTGDYAVLTLVSGESMNHSMFGEDIAASLRTSYGTMDVLVSRGKLLEITEWSRTEYGATLAGMWAFEALRIASWQPRFGLDTDAKTIPQEVGWIDTAVHLDKGCYRGQETVAKVYNTGLPPRRLVFLHLDGSVDKLPARGDPLWYGEKQAGFVGSAARHYELGPIGLGLVRYKTDPEAQLLADGVAASQELIEQLQDKPRVSRKL